ncbi:MAG: TetR/AcrR family transcriptional regulator [Anaerolineales bacterium]|nr:TetR/AcrR family transcriptional regulator [Anaerolineales bacterium]
MKQKLDRRVRRTRRLLAEALVALITEKEYESISITDITERADLNRATFYLHYGSKEELLVDMLEERFDELVQRMEALNPNRPQWETCEAEVLIFEHAAEHHQMYKVLLGENGVGYVVNRVIQYTAEVVEEDIRRYITEDDINLPLTLVAQHVAGALYAQLAWWITHDMPYTPEYMGQITHGMCMRGTADLIGNAIAVETVHNK